MKKRHQARNRIRFDRLSAALAIFCASALWSQTSQPQIVELDETVTAALAKTGAPSASVAVIRNGQIAYSKAFGKADIEKDRRAALSFIFFALPIRLRMDPSVFHRIS
jgi:CubicO group peptidase (beta-lactamase class C family)